MLQTGKIVSVIFNDDNYEDKVELNLGDYEIIEEHGKTYAVKKKKEYPKTYEECCKVLNVAVRDFDILYNMLDTTERIYSKNLDRLLNSFRKLLICRDAYWKIAGEEMGLGKPWEPNLIHGLAYTIQNNKNEIGKSYSAHGNKILMFPTEEMRDAFYENFKEEIEKCKELL